MRERIVLVFGATGQQGGSVAAALKAAGWRVRAMVRDPDAGKARALRAAGIATVRGDFADAASMRSAMADAYGVFSVQPSSGQGALYGVSDEDEVRFGTAIADLAVEQGVRHLVYSSSNAAGPGLTGMGHFDSKSRIEEHVRGVPIDTTIIRPSTFMEMLLLPGFGLDEGRFTFFMGPEQPMQFIAVEDIGHIVAEIFAHPARFRSRTLEIAGDAVTGSELAAAFTRAAGRPITYQRFPTDVLAGAPFLARLTELVDEGRLAGRADLAALRAAHPGLRNLGTWLAGAGRDGFTRALRTPGESTLPAGS